MSINVKQIKQNEDNHRDHLEEGTATHSSILAWRIPWTEEPGGLQSLGSPRAGHDWRDLACVSTMQHYSATNGGRRWHSLQHGWTLKTRCSVREARHAGCASIDGKCPEQWSPEPQRVDERSFMAGEGEWGQSFLSGRWECSEFRLVIAAQLWPYWKPLNCTL